MDRSEKWGEKTLQQFPQWVLWQPGHLASQGSPWAPYVHHETLGRTVHVGLCLCTTHMPPDTQATNSKTHKHASYAPSLTHQTQGSREMHINMNSYDLTCTPAHPLRMGGLGRREREGWRESNELWGEQRAERESSVLAAVQPLKCHPDKASNQLEHSTSNPRTHTHTYTQTPLQSCEKTLTAITGALHNSCKSNWNRGSVSVCVRAWTYVSLHVPVQHALFDPRPGTGVEVNLRDWGYVTSRHYCEKTEWQNTAQ